MENIGKYPKYKFTTAQINLPNGEVYKVCDICGEKCKSNMGIEMHFRTIGQCGFINRGFCHKCSKKYTNLPIRVVQIDFLTREEAEKALEGNK